MKFRKKPVVIEAVQWTGENSAELWEFCEQLEFRVIPEMGDRARQHNFVIKTLEGDMQGNEGDWLIRGVKGEFYPCKPDIFAATYEPVES